VSIALVFARGAYHSRHTFPSSAESRAFVHGFRHAAGMLAGGAQARAWALPEDEEAMMAIEPADAIQAAYMCVEET